ncbi:MAG: hypothetical protein ABFS12_01005 [Bacteroidota bacterium]
MKNIPLPIHQIALLQSYLYEIFTYEKKCNKSFENSEWYLKEKHTEEEVTSVLEFFKNNDIMCDCDIIHKFDLRVFSEDSTKHHQ